MIARISKFTRYVSYQKKMAPPAREQCTTVLPDRIGLPKGATISSTALVLPSDFSIEEWQTLGAKLAAFENGIQWWLGDWCHRFPCLRRSQGEGEGERCVSARLSNADELGVGCRVRRNLPT